MRTNILINDSGNDLSAEGYAALGALLEMVWGIQTMGARMARALDEIGARNCLVQRKKQAFNDAKKSINGLLKGLEAAFDETFNYAMCRVPEGTLERTEALQSYADDIVRLLILYYSRVDGAPDGNDKRERVHKAIANFKAEKIGVAPPWLNDIIKGKGKVNTKIAKKLETLFGVPAIVWMTWRAVDELNKE